MRTIEKLFIYPVKALGGIELSSVLVEKRGFKNDRRYMLTTIDGQFLTQREHPQLALIKTKLLDDGFEISSVHGNIQLPFEMNHGPKTTVQIWRNECLVNRSEKKYDDYFSEVLGEQVRLVYMPGECERPVNPEYGSPGDITTFTDGYPILVMTTASQDDLNNKLVQPVGWDRFRPSVVVKTEVAFEEDNWKNIRFGDSRLKVVKPCSRCVVTTIDQQSAVASKEPLHTLAKYRTVDHHVMYGQNVIPMDSGFEIRIGESVSVEFG